MSSQSKTYTPFPNLYDLRDPHVKSLQTSLTFSCETTSFTPEHVESAFASVLKSYTGLPDNEFQVVSWAACKPSTDLAESTDSEISQTIFEIGNSACRGAGILREYEDGLEVTVGFQV